MAKSFNDLRNDVHKICEKTRANIEDLMWNLVRDTRAIVNRPVGTVDVMEIKLLLENFVTKALDLFTDSEMDIAMACLEFEDDNGVKLTEDELEDIGAISSYFGELINKELEDASAVIRSMGVDIDALDDDSDDDGNAPPFNPNPRGGGGGPTFH